MSFRTVIINKRSKLEFRLNYLVIRSDGAETKIFINEISVLIIQSTAVSLTASLLNELIKNNVKVIFCDEKCNPSSELVSVYGAHNTSKLYKKQFEWNGLLKETVWQKIIKCKIFFESEYLKEKGFLKESELLDGYMNEVELNDITNREGHSAKVYFNCLFSKKMSRKDDSFINTCLNYGYAVLLSEINRDIVASGYLTQLGIWHKGEFNPFNLSSDLIEVFRVVVDRVAFGLEENDKDFKRKMANVLNQKVIIDGKNTTVDIAIRQYVKSVFRVFETNNILELVLPESFIVGNE